jgi:hypothetical protein
MIAAGVQGRVWKLAVTADGTRLAQMVQALGNARSPQSDPSRARLDAESVRMQAKLDILAVTAALDDFAMNNAGQYPDSLAPLVVPDMNGHRYLDMDHVPQDPWGREYLYDPPSPGHPKPRVFTLGAAGVPGGTGVDEDLDNDSAPGGR